MMTAMIGTVINTLEYHQRLATNGYEFVTRELGWHGPDDMAEILKNIDLRGATVADIGIGTGQLSQMLRGKGVRHLIGVDGVHEYLREASKVNRADSVVEADVSANGIPLADNSVDLTTASGLLPYIESLDEIIYEMIRVTKKGGHIAVNFHPHENPGSNTVEYISLTSLFPRRSSAFGVSCAFHHHDTARIRGLFNAYGAQYVYAAYTAQGIKRAHDDTAIPLSTFLFRKKIDVFTLKNI